MTHRTRKLLAMGMVGVLATVSIHAQVDPTRRELIQLGYNQPLEGHGPIAAYGFFFLNAPHFLQSSNLTLRLAVAPVYMDSELGISDALGPGTDLGIGLAGGGFADGYSEVRQGNYERKESFIGHGGELSSSLYHLFNPDSQIPLYAMLRGAVHYTTYSDDESTSRDFKVPDNQVSFRVRAGLRFGGREPLLMPALAMELSVWYEGEFRTDPNRYGFGGDRTVEAAAHRFWGRALLNYTFPEWQHSFGVNVTAGTALRADRFSAFRLGGNLPLYAEFPLTIPGYYFQELSSSSFVLLGGSYNIPLDAKKRWLINVTASTTWSDYLAGLAQPGRWNSGIGGGIVYRSPSDAWQVVAGYGYGFNAIRDDERGAQSIFVYVQFDLGRSKQQLFDPSAGLNPSRGLQQFFRSVFR